MIVSLLIFSYSKQSTIDFKFWSFWGSCYFLDVKKDDIKENLWFLVSRYWLPKVGLTIILAKMQAVLGTNLRF